MDDKYLYVLENINKIADVLLDVNDYQGKNRAMRVALITCLANKGVLDWRDVEDIKQAYFDD